MCLLLAAAWDLVESKSDVSLHESPLVDAQIGASHPYSINQLLTKMQGALLLVESIPGSAFPRQFPLQSPSDRLKLL